MRVKVKPKGMELHIHRVSLGLGMKDAENLSGISRRTLYSIEKENLVSLSTAQRLSKAYGIDWELYFQISNN